MLPVEGRHPSVQAFADKFRWEHLPTGLPQETSRIFAEAAEKLVCLLPDSPEIPVALCKLWEAKNEAVYHSVNVYNQLRKDALYNDPKLNR